MNNKRSYIHNETYFIKIFILGLILNLFVVGILIIFGYQYKYDKSYENVLATQETELEYIDSIISNRINHAVIDMEFLSSVNGVDDFILKGDDEANLQLIALFSTYISKYPEYKNISLLDIEGNLIFEVEGDDSKVSALNITVPVFNQDVKIGYLSTELSLNKIINTMKITSNFKSHLIIFGQNQKIYCSKLNSESDSLNTEQLFMLIEQNINSMHKFTNDGLFSYRIINPFEESQLTEKNSVLDNYSFYLVNYIPYDYFLNLSFKIFNDIYLIPLTLFSIFLILNIVMAYLFDNNKFRQNQIAEYAAFDDMTGAYNRRVGMEFLEKLFIQNIRNEDVLSVVFFDVNNLKKINDMYGHNEGDLIIIDIVEIASKYIRQSDILVRMGGDEFVIIFPNCNYQDADSIMKRFQENLFNINDDKNNEYNISISFGVADTSNKEIINVDQLLKLADKRMYKNKNQYKLDHLLDSIK
jgi:diguanylate cyclase (GGDEF)-like protein